MRSSSVVLLRIFVSLRITAHCILSFLELRAQNIDDTIISQSLDFLDDAYDGLRLEEEGTAVWSGASTTVYGRWSLARGPTFLHGM
jgi:hypothetical protein